MNKPIILSAATSVFVTVAILLAAHGASQAKGSVPDMDMMIIDKSDRLPVPYTIDEWDEAASEWVLDCYDQFGPEGARDDAAALNSCLTPS